jgi:solute carrier family 25 protein 34/35
MARVTAGPAAQLATYDWCKRQVLRRVGLLDGLAAAFVAAMASGVAVVLALNPFDVVSTRLYNQPVSGGRPELYRGFTDCLRKIASTEGLLAFYKGAGAGYLRTGPHTVLTFVLWEQLKRLRRTWDRQGHGNE